MRKLAAAMLSLGVALGAAWVYMVSDEKRFEALSKALDAILDRVPVGETGSPMDRPRWLERPSADPERPGALPAVRRKSAPAPRACERSASCPDRNPGAPRDRKSVV